MVQYRSYSLSSFISLLRLNVASYSIVSGININQVSVKPGAVALKMFLVIEDEIYANSNSGTRFQSGNQTLCSMNKDRGSLRNSISANKLQQLLIPKVIRDTWLEELNIK